MGNVAVTSLPINSFNGMCYFTLHQIAQISPNKASFSICSSGTKKEQLALKNLSAQIAWGLCLALCSVVNWDNLTESREDNATRLPWLIFGSRQFKDSWPSAHKIGCDL
jgi:hypothetical protein